MKIHIVAGILIGYFNEAWSIIIVAALLWGFVFCLMMLRSYKGRKEQYMNKLKSSGKQKQFGLPLRYAYYAKEFVNATGIAYLIGSIVYAIKDSL